MSAPGRMWKLSFPFPSLSHTPLHITIKVLVRRVAQGREAVAVCRMLSARP